MAIHQPGRGNYPCRNATDAALVARAECDGSADPTQLGHNNSRSDTPRRTSESVLTWVTDASDLDAHRDPELG